MARDAIGPDQEIVADPDQIVPLDTKIVVSFPASSGGTPFVGWLYRRLRQRFALATPTSVYVDSICAGILPMTDIHQVVRKKAAGNRLISPNLPTASVGVKTATKIVGLDQRSSMSTTHDPYLRSNFEISTHPVSTRRDDWDLLFKSAVRAARVMIIVLNQQYLASLWCNYEVQLAVDEDRRRHKMLKHGMKIVVLKLDDVSASDDLIRQRIPRAKVVSAQKFTGTGVKMGATTLPATQPWVIPDDAFERLVKAIGSLH